MGEVFLDAFLDTLKILPFLLIMNFLIEFVEYRSKGLKADKLLKGGFAPFIGTAVGIVPQCGFSVVATELYGKRRIALGTLLAVYLATSDEALPIMLSSYEGLVKLFPVLIIKVCFSLAVGYAAFGIEKLAARGGRSNGKPYNTEEQAADKTDGSSDHAHGDHEHIDEDHAHGDEAHCRAEHTPSGETSVRLHGCHHHDLEEKTPPDNATRKQKAAWVWRTFLMHPLLHTATVILFIFIVNALFGAAVYYIGEERLAAFIGSTGYLQPVLASLVGLIPNCAASVVITELYVVGGLNLGGTVAGLCVSAGIGYAVLVKQNRPIKNTVFIILLVYALSVALGVCVTACGF